MSALQITKSTNAVNIWFDDIKMVLILDDGRELSIPINWFPSLRDATPEQRNNWRFIGDGEGIHWDDLDEDILVYDINHSALDNVETYKKIYSGFSREEVLM